MSETTDEDTTPDEEPKPDQGSVEIARAIITLQTNDAQLEAMLSQLLLGYVELTSMVEAMRLHLVENGDEEFAKLVGESRMKVLSTLDQGGKVGQETSDKFYSSASEPDKS